MLNVSRKDLITERFCGVQKARRAISLAEKNRWEYRIIKNANGLRGMYARTDAEVTRPMTSEEKREHCASLLAKLDDDKLLRQAIAIVPSSVIEAAFVNNIGLVRISHDVVSRLVLVTPRRTEPHYDLYLILRINFPILTSRQKELLTRSDCYGRDPGQNEWEFLSDDVIASIKGRLKELSFKSVR